MLTLPTKSKIGVGRCESRSSVCAECIDSTSDNPRKSKMGLLRSS